jgi:hypothetical protein
VITDQEKAEIAARIAAVKAKLDSLNAAVQTGAPLRALLADADLGHDVVNLLVDVAFQAGT